MQGGEEGTGERGRGEVTRRAEGREGKGELEKTDPHTGRDLVKFQDGLLHTNQRDY